MLFGALLIPDIDFSRISRTLIFEVFWFAEVKATGNSFGKYFQVTTSGESHGGSVDCIISGCPPRLPLSEADVQFELDRRFS